MVIFYAILGGAVYVYYNSQDGLSPDRDRVRLVSRADRHSGSEDGFEAREGRFGLSVSGAGDLNADGAQVWKDFLKSFFLNLFIVFFICQGSGCRRPLRRPRQGLHLHGQRGVQVDGRKGARSGN